MSSQIEQLKELAALKDLGVISEEEFNQQKTEILRSLSQQRSTIPPKQPTVPPLQKRTTNQQEALTGKTITAPSNNPFSSTRDEGHPSFKTNSSNPEWKGSTIVHSPEDMPLKNQAVPFSKENFEGKTMVENANILGGKTIVDPPKPDKKDTGAASQEHLGQKIGSYQILSLIGKGGMGSVFRARHELEEYARQTGDVAIKLMHSQFTTNSNFRKRFIQEAALGRKLQHEGIADVLDVIAEGETLALVMEYVKGEELTHKISPTGMSLQESIPILRHLAEALDFLHKKNVIHRDLKPDNVKIRPNGHAVILDLGIAKKQQSSKELTADETAMGTIAYMAPEQMNAKKVQGSADQYSLGMICYELLTGQLPWPKETTAFGVITHKMTDDLLPISHYCKNLPSGLESTLHKVLSQNPNDRFSTCCEFITQLENCSRGKVTTTKPIKKRVPTPAPPPQSSSQPKYAEEEMRTAMECLRQLQNCSGYNVFTTKDDRKKFIAQMASFQSHPAIRKVLPVIVSIGSSENIKIPIFQTAYSATKTLTSQLPDVNERKRYLEPFENRLLAAKQKEKHFFIFMGAVGVFAVFCFVMALISSEEEPQKNTENRQAQKANSKKEDEKRLAATEKELKELKSNLSKMKQETKKRVKEQKTAKDITKLQQKIKEMEIEREKRKLDMHRKLQEIKAEQKTNTTNTTNTTNPFGVTKEDTPSHSDVLFVASGKYFPPMFDLRHNTPKGFDIDLAKEIGRRMGKSKTVFHSYKSPRRSLRKEGNSFAVAAISITAPRRKENLFSVPYIETEYVLIKNNHTSPPTNLLTSTCSVGPNAIYKKLLRKTGCQMQKFSSNNRAIQALKNQQVDYSITERFRAESQKIVAYKIVKVLGRDTLGVAFERGNEALKYKIDKIINNMKKDGFLQRLRKRYNMD